MNFTREPVAVYAAYSTDEELRMKSSSGAVFTELSRIILERSGLVYGAALSPNCLWAEFIRADSMEKLDRLRGSKYLQARMGNIFGQVRQDLERGSCVLFTGTGCQINGLKNFLGRDYEGLYCADVICHGVPSPGIWREYVNYLESRHKARLKAVNFRCKDKIWNDRKMIRVDSSSYRTFELKDNDPFMKLFLSDYILRPACYNCMAKKEKQSDITIGDFWGIEKAAPDMYNETGTSVVIIRTRKGNQLFESVRNNLCCREVTYSAAAESNPAEYRSVYKPDDREKFFSDYRKMSFEQLIKKYPRPARLPLKRRVKKILKHGFSAEP